MSNHLHVAAKAKRLRFAPLAIATGVLGAVLLSVSMSGTLSGFVASITNSNDTASTGTLLMQETNSGATVTCLSTDGGTISTNASTCSTINKYGGVTNMIPGQTVSTSITITNKGTVNASTFTLAPGVCSYANNGTLNGTATDICSKMTVTLTNNAAPTTNIFSGTLAAFKTGGTITLPALASNASASYTFAVTLPSTANDNAYQGLTASQPLVWSFTS